MPDSTKHYAAPESLCAEFPHGLHEFCQHRRLDDGDAPDDGINALSMKHCSLQQDYCADSDVEVDEKDRELFELVHSALVQRRFRADIGYHEGLLSTLVRE